MVKKRFTGNIEYFEQLDKMESGDSIIVPSLHNLISIVSYASRKKINLDIIFTKNKIQLTVL